MTLTDIPGKQAYIHDWCERKGWNEKPVTFSEAMALLHEEMSEALQAWRKWEFEDATNYVTTPVDDALGIIPKPEGVGSEFADVLIRLLDNCQRWDVNLGQDLMSEADITDVGNHSSFAEDIDALHILAARCSMDFGVPGNRIGFWFANIYRLLMALCEKYDVNLEWEYNRKMAYNETRPHRHGGQPL